MQLSRLYSNENDLFAPIDFNCGARARLLNVIYAQVNKPKDANVDSHNLGKTTLIHLLDFCLLRNMGEVGDHFLSKHGNRFQRFVFFLEVLTNSGDFVTIRRSVSEPTAIALLKHPNEKADFSGLADEAWDHSDVGVEPARLILDSYLNLTWAKPFSYRKGFSYFLRTQNDYGDVFQIGKFIQGKDRDWKPYLAKVYGLEHVAAYEKYLLDHQISEAEAGLKEKESGLSKRSIDRNTLATDIEIKRDEITQIQEGLDQFDFSEEERRINRRLVDEIEAKIASLLSGLYDIRSDIGEINQSISTGFSFDLDKVAQIFQESSVLFPDAIKRDYQDLVDFNKSITRDRNMMLRKRLKELLEQEASIVDEHNKLSEKRSEYMAIIKNADTFRKYKLLQNELAERRADLAILAQQLRKLDEIGEIQKLIRELREKRLRQIEIMDMSLRRDDLIKNQVVRLFNRYVNRVLGINGEFLITQNAEGNYNFSIRTKDNVGIETSQSDGKTYGHLLCALFDLATLKALEDFPFFHFVYHDGLLEGLDNRKKLKVLELVRDCISEGKIQYLLSVIESDLPRDDSDKKIEFETGEIVLRLNDEGDQGRLFRMPPF